MSMIKQTLLSNGNPLWSGAAFGGSVSCSKVRYGLWVVESYSKYFGDETLIIDEFDNTADTDKMYYQRIEEIKELIVANGGSVGDHEQVFPKPSDAPYDLDTFREDRFKLKMAYKRGGVDEYLEVKKELLELRTKEDVNNYIWLDGLPYKNEEVL